MISTTSKYFKDIHFFMNVATMIETLNPYV
jgi:hypothetical protein